MNVEVVGRAWTGDRVRLAVGPCGGGQAGTRGRGYCGATRRRRDRSVALVGVRARHLRWVAARSREAELAGASGTDVPSDRCDRRSPHHVPSILLMPIYGFLPATDPRMRSTIEAVSKELTEDGLVLRYRPHDGLSGDEGTFVICSFWLVSCLAKAGEIGRAEALFERLVDHANDLGLLAEEIDPTSGELLGNFPQAFSHIGLITAAWDLDQARESHTTS